MTIRNFNSIYSSYSSEVISADLSNQVTTAKWDNRFDGLTLFNSQVRVAKLLTVDGDSKVGGALDASGAATFGSTLNATGAVAFGNTLSVAGDTTFSGVLKGPAKFTIDPAAYGDETGTVIVRGNLVSNGTLAASGAVTVGGATTLNNTLYASGSITSGSHVIVGPVWGNASLYANGQTNRIGTMGAGEYAFNVYSTKNTWTLGSVSTFNSSFTVGGNAPTDLQGTLHGVGAATFDSTLAASGAVAFGSTLSVGGDTTLTGVLRGPAQFTIDPSAYGDETGTVTVRGNLVSNGTLAASGAVTVGGATTLNNTLYGAGAATFGSTLAASGAITSGGHVIVGPVWGNAYLYANGPTNRIGSMGGGDYAFNVYSTKNTGNMGSVSTFNSSFTVGGNAPTDLQGTLRGAGAATFGSTLAASGAVAFGSTLSVASTGSFGALTVSGVTTLDGVLRGPPDFIIDPAAYNDETGTVTIRGNLLVKGLTTTINSATLDVADLNLTLAKGSLTKTTSNGAGLTIDLGTGGLAEFKYQDTFDNFRVNKLVRCASGPVDVDDLTNKAYVDARIVAAASTITPNTIGLSLINGFKFKVITVAGDFSGTDICMTENNILYIWNNGVSFSVDLPYIHNTVPGVKSTPLYNGMNMFAYRVTATNAEDHWTDSV